MRNLCIIIGLVALAFAYFTYQKESVLSPILEDNEITSEPAHDHISRIASDVISRLEVPHRELPSSGKWESNLLVNGGFEQSLQGWSFDSGVYWSNNGGESGSGALLINAPEIVPEGRIIYSKSVKQCVAINGTSKYAIEARFRYLDTLPERPSINRIHLYWYDSTDCSMGGQYGTYVEPSLEKHTWQKVFSNNLKPSLGAQSAQIKIEQRQDGNNNAEAIWDTVLFIETIKGDMVENIDVGSEIYSKPIGTNYLRNPNFNLDISAWSPSQSPRLQHRVIDGLNRNGVMAATLPRDKDGSMGTGSFQQCVNIGISERYELGAQVKVDPESSQRGGGRLRATWYEGLDCTGRYRGAHHHADVDKDAIDWQSLHIDELVPRRGSKSVNIGIVHSIEGQGQHILLWDDFYFRDY